MALQLQTRDEKIMLYLLKYKVATIYQIRDHLGIDCRRHTFHRRLRRLVNHKILRETYWDKKRVYGLGKVGQDYLYHAGKIQKIYRLNHLGIMPNQIKHDVTLNDVLHHILKVNPVAKVRTHNQFLINKPAENEMRNVPDAIIRWPIWNQLLNIAIELELSEKKNDRYQKVLFAYHKNGLIHAVFYLAGAVSKKNIILNVAKQYSRLFEDKVYVTLAESFLKNPLSCPFESATGRIITLSKPEFLISNKQNSSNPRDTDCDSDRDIMSQVI